MIETKIRKLRDPFILVENGVYYAYGTGCNGNDWNNTTYDCYKNTDGSLDGKWTKLEKPLYEIPKNAVKNFWAPEVHKYNGQFYMFATYYSSLTERRGVTVMRSQSPEGPFVEISDGHITPDCWDCIDGTLYVDGNGEPWMVFVHEWTSTDDRIGRKDVAKLSADLTHFVSEPVELFRADDPAWSHGQRVTDGCFMYTTKDNKLLMIWSNFCGDGYCVGIAESENGKVDGKWTQSETLLYKRGMFSEFDGGHGMIFTDTDNTKYLCIHSPNEPKDGHEEVPVLIRVVEENGTIVLKAD